MITSNRLEEFTSERAKKAQYLLEQKPGFKGEEL